MIAVLHAVGAIYVTTMREFDALCLPNVYELSPSKIKSIRKQVKLSQAVFARIINVSIAAIKQWEQGEQKPSGVSLKLLNLVETESIEELIS